MHLWQRIPIAELSKTALQPQLWPSRLLRPGIWQQRHGVISKLVGRPRKRPALVLPGFHQTLRPVNPVSLRASRISSRSTTSSSTLLELLELLGPLPFDACAVISETKSLSTSKNNGIRGLKFNQIIESDVSSIASSRENASQSCANRSRRQSLAPFDREQDSQMQSKPNRSLISPSLSLAGAHKVNSDK